MTPATATSELQAKRARRALPEEGPGEQAAGNEQQRENRGDDARGDVLLGEIDRVEVDAELREAEEDRGEHSLAAEAQVLAFPGGERGHGDCRDRRSGT